MKTILNTDDLDIMANKLANEMVTQVKDRVYSQSFELEIATQEGARNEFYKKVFDIIRKTL